MSETTFFQDGNVLITNARAIFGNKTYAMSNITSVSTWQISKDEDRKVPGIVLLGGIGSVALGIFMVSEMDMKLYLIGAGLLASVLGYFWYMSIKDDYSVRINTAGAENDAIKSPDNEWIDKIVTSMNDAIIHRG